MKEFKVGDIVSLKSGSEEMTIDMIFEDDARCLCVYFYKGKLQEVRVSLDAVTKFISI